MKALEQGIIARLAGGLPTDELKLIAWPEQPMSTGRPVGKAAVMVRFSGLRLDSPGTVNRGPVIQSGNLDVELRFLVKDLRSHVGAYPLMSAAQQALTGYLPEADDLDKGISPRLPGFHLVTAQLVDRYDGDRHWDWGQMYSLQVDYRGVTHNGRR